MWHGTNYCCNRCEYFFARGKLKKYNYVIIFSRETLAVGVYCNTFRVIGMLKTFERGQFILIPSENSESLLKSSNTCQLSPQSTKDR